MCLGLPAKIVGWVDESKRLGRAQLPDGSERPVNLVSLPGSTEDLLGCHVMMHLGFATSVVTEEEAKASEALLAEIAALMEVS